jgi:hypothetical protein
MFVLYQANVLTTAVIISANIPFLLLVSVVTTCTFTTNEEYHETRNINLIFCSLQQTTHGIAHSLTKLPIRAKKYYFLFRTIISQKHKNCETNA